MSTLRNRLRNRRFFVALALSVGAVTPFGVAVTSLEASPATAPATARTLNR